MTDDPFGLVPKRTQISNRRFIDRLVEWGWVITKTSGEWTHLRHINTFHRVKVRSATYHRGNSPDTIQQVLNLMEMTWEKFMAFDIPTAVVQIAQEDNLIVGLEKYRATGEITPAVDALVRDHYNDLHEEAIVEDAKRTARKVRKQHEAEARQQREEARKRMSTDAVPQVVDLTDVNVMEELERITAPDEVETPEQRTTRVRIINRVFDLLVESGEPMSAVRIAEALGDTSRASATGALLGLVRYGVAERVKPGVYRAVVDMQQQRTLRHNVQGTVPVTVSSPLQAAPTQVDPLPAAALQRPVQAVQPTSATEDEIINDVLDLMFPNGMRIRAADITLLDQWKNLTGEVLRRVGG